MISLKIVKTDEQRRIFMDMYREYCVYLTSIGHDIIANPMLPDEKKELQQLRLDCNRQILAFHDNEVAGCIALERMNNDVCEMKRMFVLPKYRDLGVGRALTMRIIEEAREMGYKSMKLSTLPYLKEALAIYRSIGFKDIDPYYEDDANDVIYLELLL